MNISQAKKIALTIILEKSGCRPVSIKKEGTEIWYCSPFRKESTPSFHIETERNVWYDFGEGRGGDVIEFVKIYNDTDTRGALRWLEEIMSREVIIKRVGQRLPLVKKVKAGGIELLSTGSVKSSLHNYLQERRIPKEIYEKYLQEVKFRNTTTEKKYFALAFENRSKGFEIRNKYFKSTIGKKDITILKGQEEGGGLIHVFEGFIDFLTMLTMHEISAPRDDVIVLNSISFCDRAKAYISAGHYERIVCWTDNDQGGKRALSEFEELPLRVQFMGSFYEDYNDLNEWYIAENS